MNIDVSKEQKFFGTNMRGLSEIESGMGEVTCQNFGVNSDKIPDFNFHMIKYKVYMQEAFDLKQMIPTIQLDHLETNEFVIPTNAEDDKISTMLELRKKRSIIIFKMNEYYKKAYKHLIK